MSINFAELRTLHQRAMSGGPKSNSFALFAATMYWQFDEIYTAALDLQDDNQRLRDAACRPTLKPSVLKMDADQVGAALEAGQAADLTSPAPARPFRIQRKGKPGGDSMMVQWVPYHAGHTFVGLDFHPVSEGMPDDDRLVFLLFAQENADDTPILMGFRDAGFWFGVDGMTISLSYTVIGWADMPEVVRG